MSNIDDRTLSLLGKENVQKLKDSCVALIGLGGVGGAIFDALVRIGIGKIHVIDFDKFDESNLNRQLLSNKKNIGEYKILGACNYADSIRDDIKITYKNIVLSKDNVSEAFYDNEKKQIAPDFIIDAIDFIPAKVALIQYAKENNIEIISAMGMGKKVHPELIELSDISKTTNCPVARKIRKELKELKIKNVMVCWTKELPINNDEKIIGSISFVPNTCGNIMAGYVVRTLLKIK